MEYDLLGEDWGSEDLEDKGTYVEPGEQVNYDPPDPSPPYPDPPKMEEGTGDTRYFQKRLITSTIPDYFQKLGEMGPVARVKDQKPRGSSRSARRTSSTTTTPQPPTTTTTTGPPMTREEDWGE